jgi:hypothetical protein
LELLNSPEDCIISKHPLFDFSLRKQREYKKAVKTFGGCKTANKKS